MWSSEVLSSHSALRRPGPGWKSVGASVGVGVPHFYKPRPTHTVLFHGGSSVTSMVPGTGTGWSTVKQKGPLPSLNQVDFTSALAGNGNNKLLPKEKMKSKHKMYFFPGLHVPGLTYITYVIVILFVRTVQTVSGKARNASLGFGPPGFWHRKNWKAWWMCGSQECLFWFQLPHPAHRKRNAALQTPMEERLWDKKGRVGTLVLGSWNPWTLWI